MQFACFTIPISTNSFHNLRFHGECSHSIVVRAGVGLGCPMSPLLFALALDSFLSVLCSQVQICDIVRAYADDMALVLHPLNTIPEVASCFNLLEQASAFHANIRKTILIPLFTTSSQQARSDIRRTQWVQMEAHPGYGKCLGFQAGLLATGAPSLKGALSPCLWWRC